MNLEPESNIGIHGIQVGSQATEGGYLVGLKQPGKFPHFDSPVFSEHAHCCMDRKNYFMTHLIMDALASGVKFGSRYCC